VKDFISGLIAMAPAAGDGYYAFVGGDGAGRGFVQIIRDSDDQITIYRLWTLQPGAGNGAMMLRALCELADRYGVLMHLKPLPFGRKPYPMNRDQLLGWYRRHGFEGTRRKMIRKPRRVASGATIPVPELRETTISRR
jgi:hypothetical protein